MEEKSIITQLYGHPDFLKLSIGLTYILQSSTHSRETFVRHLLAHGTGGYDLEFPRLTKQRVEQRQQIIDTLRKEFPQESIQEWLNEKQLEVELLRELLNLPKSPNIAKIRALNEQLFGYYDPSLFYYCIAELEKKALVTDRATYFNEAKEQLERIDSVDIYEFRPDKETFEYYKALLKDDFALLDRIIDGYEYPDVMISAEKLAAMLNDLLEAIGAKEQGWSVQIHPDTIYINVNARRRIVNVREGVFRLSRSRLRGLLAHEVLVHVRRKLPRVVYDETLLYDQEPMYEEGLGVFIEQLSLNRFEPLRTFRYLAIGLIVGTDGRPRSFIEAYNILWRMRYAVTNATVEQAQKYAIDELLRIFRGVPPAVAGAAFERGKMYLEGNISIWQSLKKERLDVDTFRELMTGVEV